jgi:CubicO group peptidase (beta-lactamase class C family)
LLVALAGALRAQAPRQSVGTDTTRLRLDRRALEPLIDSLFAEGLARTSIPGATIAVVERGRVVLEKGYGLADVERRVPMDPASTRFSVGSITKLVTATAILQLVERGVVTLDEDVNRYLRSLDIASQRPITLEHLLTHTSGLDRRGIALAVRDRQALIPLNRYLAHNLPPLIHPPGATFVSTDIGVALAGLVVEEASGHPYAAYVDTAVLAPLGMTRSVVRPEAVADSDRAVAYYGIGERRRRAPMPYLLIGPGRALVTTAHDMTRLMHLLLGDGAVDGRRVLSPSSVAEMRRIRVSQHPELAGYGFGLYEHSYGGTDGLRHAGAMSGHSAVLWLLPQFGIGVFLAMNHDDAESFGDQVLEAMHLRFLPGDALRAMPVAPPVFAARAERFRGYYLKQAFGSRGIERLGRELFAPFYRVRPTSDDALAFEDSRGVRRAVEVSPNLFAWQWRDEVDHVAFGTGDYGAVDRLFVGLDTFDRLPWYRDRRLELTLGALVLLVFVSTLAQPITGVLNRLARRRDRAPRRYADKWVIRTATVIGLANLVCVGGMYYYLVARPYQEMGFEVPAGMVGVLWIPLVTGVLSLVVLVALIVRRPSWPERVRKHVVGVALAGLVFTLGLAAMEALAPQQVPIRLDVERR